jgi:hypothetical protein
MPGGQTLAHVLHRCRYGKVGDHVFCVDEIGQIPLSTWGRIGQWQLVGAKFVLMGDFDGQFEPIYDAWRGDVKNADILRQLSRRPPRPPHYGPEERPGALPLLHRASTTSSIKVGRGRRRRARASTSWNEPTPNRTRT